MFLATQVGSWPRSKELLRALRERHKDQISRKQFDEIIKLVRKHKQKVALITDTVDRLQRSFRETPLLDEMRR